MSGWNSPVRGWAMPLADTVAIKGPYRIDCDVGDLAVCYDLWRMQIGMSVERYLRAWPVGMMALHETTGDAGRVFTLWVRAKGGAQQISAVKDVDLRHAFGGHLGPLVALRDLPRDGQWHAGIIAATRGAAP